MKYVFFSDVHADIDALEKLTGHEVFIEADKRICLGDTFNAHIPDSIKSSFESVKAVSDVILLGNHEGYMAGTVDSSVFSEKIRDDLSIARTRIAKEDPTLINELSSLSARFTDNSVAATHASFDPLLPWTHVRYIEDLDRQLSYLEKPVNIMGHGHVPFIAWQDDGLWYYQRFIYDKLFQINPMRKYIINVGSILGSRELRQYEQTFMAYDSTQSEVRFFNLGESM